MRSNRMFLPALALAAVFLSGCAEKFTRERFDMIQVGTDDREDVEQLLGSPRHDLVNEWYYENMDKHIHARVFFGMAGKVSGKEWMDAGTGEWEGAHPDADAPPKGEVRERNKTTRTIDRD